MSRPKLLLIGYRAYGDWIFTMPAITELLKHYDIHLEMNRKGWALFHNDPRFVDKTLFEYERFKPEDQIEAAQMRWEKLEEVVEPDHTINLWQTLEVECLVEPWQEEFPWTDEQRRAVHGKRNFIDSVFRRCGLDHMIDTEFDRGEFYASPHERSVVNKFRDVNRDRFVIMVPACGSCFNKLYPYMPKLTTELCDKYSDIKVYLSGDKESMEIAWTHPQIEHLVDMPFKQAVHMTQHANFVMGGETGLLAAAGMYGTPKRQFTTSSSVWQICKYDKNDYSVQAGVDCSPCHKAVLNYECCHGMVLDPVPHAKCVDGFDYDDAFKTVEKVYKEWKDERSKDA